ncbi:hypothetical protein [Streptomyces sp. NPDC001404]|uniref:hypothetical protein n=1 Tax=Streptomyces sp. NPDC001404 TaxID=3364571 RepID=UPI003683D309
MAITVSAVLLLLIVLIVMMRSGSLRALPALVAIGFGFLLASTGIAPSIHHVLQSLADAAHGIKF